MESDGIPAQLLRLLKPQWAIVLLSLGGIILVGIGFFQYFQPASPQDEVIIQKAADASVQTASNEAKIFIDVAGAVELPGVYELPAESRLQDALLAAGGLRANASREAVAKQLNLAAKVRDGEKLYIPFEGEESVSGLPQSDVAGIATSARAISLNTATVSELDTLPGVGPVTAEKIVSNRPYSSLDEVVSKKAIGQSAFDKIKDKVSL